MVLLLVLDALLQWPRFNLSAQKEVATGCIRLGEFIERLSVLLSFEVYETHSVDQNIGFIASKHWFHCVDSLQSVEVSLQQCIVLDALLQLIHCNLSAQKKIGR